MAPRDMWDANPIYETSRWEAYLAFVREQLGHFHVQDMEDSEFIPGEDEEVALNDAWELGPHEEFDIFEEEEDEESSIQELMEFLDSLGPRVGTRQNPIDLTMDSE